MDYLRACPSLSPHQHVCLCASGRLSTRVADVYTATEMVGEKKQDLGTFGKLGVPIPIPTKYFNSLSLLHTEMMPDSLPCKISMAFSVWKSSLSQNGEGIYFRGQETDSKSSETVTLLEIGPIRYSFKKWLSFKILLSLGCGGGTIYSSLWVNEFNMSKRLLELGRESQVKRRIQEIMQRKVL